MIEPANLPGSCRPSKEQRLLRNFHRGTCSELLGFQKGIAVKRGSACCCHNCSTSSVLQFSSVPGLCSSEPLGVLLGFPLNLCTIARGIRTEEPKADDQTHESDVTFSVAPSSPSTSRRQLPSSAPSSPGLANLFLQLSGLLGPQAAMLCPQPLKLRNVFRAMPQPKRGSHHRHLPHFNGRPAGVSRNLFRRAGLGPVQRKRTLMTEFSIFESERKLPRCLQALRFFQPCHPSGRETDFRNRCNSSDAMLQPLPPQGSRLIPCTAQSPSGTGLCLAKLSSQHGFAGTCSRRR
mmetsp:Transcript_122113/g.390547  ORF Transcript_122113/g.390547 Transcript_122113/m.390547 type:complete len:292 (-) Transcript_122113:773-1648(-)